MTDRVSITVPWNRDPNGLVTVPNALKRMLDDIPGVQYDDGVTAVSLIDFARAIVADFEEESRTPNTHMVDTYGDLAPSELYEQACTPTVHPDGILACEVCGTPITTEND